MHAQNRGEIRYYFMDTVLRPDHLRRLQAEGGWYLPHAPEFGVKSSAEGHVRDHRSERARQRQLAGKELEPIG